MKRLIAVLLLTLLLCGCGGQASDPTLPPSTDPAPAAAPTEPAGLYDPGHSLEEATGGALQAFPLKQDDAWGIIPMGDGLLLFSGQENTTLTRLSGATLYETASAALSCFVSPASPTFQISDKGITYYDSDAQELVFLDTELKEVSRFSLPEGIQGEPALSGDRKLLYYCRADSLRCLDLETGIDRLLKEMTFPDQYIVSLHCGDTVLECGVRHEGGSVYELYISTQTGELLYESMESIDLWTQDDLYLAAAHDGVCREILVGSAHFGPSALETGVYEVTPVPVLELGGGILITADAEQNETLLNYYDLHTGKRTASLTLPGTAQLTDFSAGPDGRIWFLRHDEQERAGVICCWDTSRSAVSDDTVYLTPRRTADAPDLDGLEQCAEEAERLSEKHGVQIHVWQEAAAIQPWDYTLVPEYQVSLILHDLKLLDEALSLYPEGFFAEAASGSSSETLHLCLVRSILGNADSGVLDSANGLQFWDDRPDAYICVTPGADMVQALHHELFHIIDSRVLSTCSAYDNWNELNPDGFSYDFDYIINLSRTEDELVSGETRAFIDAYSMSYPKEDRARMMEYAIGAGNSSYFESETMQRKLRQLCLGIREAFGLGKETAVYPWEQYLKEPLSG